MKKEKQHIPAGYKLSPLGPIPEDWEVKRLGEVCTFHNGRAYSQKELLSSGKYRVLRVGNFFTNSSWYWSDMELENDKYANNGDLLYAWSASFGPRFWKGEKVIYHYHIWKIDSFKTISKEFLYSFLLYDAAMLSSTLQGGTMVHVTKENMEKRNIAIPSIIEQNKIVDLLSLWDTAISKQAQLVEKLTLRKRGLMQQLLTGKKRLKGFSGEWKMVKLGECGNFLSNNTLSREQLNERSGTVQNIHYGDVLIKYLSILDCDKVTLPFINESAYKDSMTDFVKDGDIVISDTAEDETVGKACEVQNIGTKKILAGLHTMLFRPEKGLFSPFFMGYYFNSEVYHSKLIPLIQGIKVCSIGKQAIQNTIVIIPSIDEQNAIASVLINADKEIEKQKQKLAAMQEEKKGLMQVLLTGKKRII